MADITFEHVEKIYPGGIRAVVDLDLQIEDGELVTLVGPSGCGKSTTLRLMAGLEQTTKGTLRIGKRIVNDIPARDRDVAMVFQNYALYPHMTVYQNLAFGLKLRKIPKQEIDHRIRSTAEILAIDKLLNRKPPSLSGGQRQRVALGRAVVRRPRVFLFDEPLSNLDARQRIVTRAEIKRLQRELKTTTIYVTHDQEEAMSLGDRVAVMNGGEVFQYDTPLNIYHRPSDCFTAGFIGVPPMNFIIGELQNRAGKFWFCGGGIELQLTVSQINKFAKQLPETLVVGIRPEAFYLPNLATGSASQKSVNTVTVRIRLVEFLGSVMDLQTFTSQGQVLVARLESHSVEPNSQIELHVQAEQIHVFEPNEIAGSEVIRYGRNLGLSFNS